MSTLLQKPKGKGPCPTWFFGTCRDAALGVRGNVGGYEGAGYAFAGHVGQLQPYDLDPEEWSAELDKFEGYFRFGQPGQLVSERRDPDGPAILAWIGQHMPRCLAMIPENRREQFLAGICRAADEGELCLEM